MDQEWTTEHDTDTAQHRVPQSKTKNIAWENKEGKMTT